MVRPVSEVCQQVYWASTLRHNDRLFHFDIFFCPVEKLFKLPPPQSLSRLEEKTSDEAEGARRQVFHEPAVEEEAVI